MSKPDPEELRILRENYEERAAIKEYLGNLSREEAEREAFQEVYGEKKS
jgi:hypothetical protein